MKIESIHNDATCRASTVTISSLNNVESALLFEFLQKIKREPPRLNKSLLETLALLHYGPLLTSELAAHFEISLPAANNRARRLTALNLVTREQVESPSGGNQYLYTSNEGD